MSEWLFLGLRLYLADAIEARLHKLSSLANERLQRRVDRFVEQISSASSAARAAADSLSRPVGGSGSHVGLTGAGGLLPQTPARGEVQTSGDR